MDTPCEVCEKRDVKGLYKKAREGKIKGIKRERECIADVILFRIMSHKICICIMMAAIFSDTFSNLVQVLLELTVPTKNRRILILC